MSPTRQPILGSASIEAPTPQLIRVTESTCFQLSLFKDLMREYRKLDDSITMRLNRNNAFWQEKERSSGRYSSSLDEPCEYFWKELVANWKGRTAVIDYCVNVVDQSSKEKKQMISGQEAGLDADKRLRSSIHSDEVKRNQIRQELTVETIIRRRTWEGSVLARNSQHLRLDVNTLNPLALM